ncbi:hypothetical protein ACFP7A_13940 [Sporolactobacillus kofuensis]|uniref:Uncharacterized protein n=1 Tax=Sporolactobacillus kofuensis TaxID=269672 RepID=A0ABW1WH34_9BACL|nr:hypothetical protein [Sporolactobacillus kofuensis]MCO7177085.1 hypothetical protein [Sporolactobacillus kofuensis]
MEQYCFYLEYDGKRTVSHSYESPAAVINSEGIRNAIHSFAEKNSLKVDSQESLTDGNYRVFFVKRSLFGGGREFVYYVKHE